MSGFDAAALAALIEPMVERAVKAAVQEVVQAVRPGPNWEGWYKDLQTEMERESWKQHSDGFRYCQRCGAWEAEGHEDVCFWRKWTRDGKVEVKHG